MAKLRGGVESVKASGSGHELGSERVIKPLLPLLLSQVYSRVAIFLQ